MINLQQLTYLASPQFFFVTFALTIASSYAIGYLLHRILGDMSFSTHGNTFLVLLGIVVAIAIGPAQPGVMEGPALIRLSVLAGSISTGLVMSLCGLKSYLLDIRV